MCLIVKLFAVKLVIYNIVDCEKAFLALDNVSCSQLCCNLLSCCNLIHIEMFTVIHNMATKTLLPPPKYISCVLSPLVFTPHAPEVYIVA